MRELAARFADDRVVAVRQTLDKAVRVAGLGGGDDFLVCRVRFAHGDVLANRSRREPRVLQNHADVFAQIVARQAARLVVVHVDFAGIHIVEAHEQVDHRRLAAACRADDGDALAGLNVQREIFDQLAIRGIGEMHMVDGDFAVGLDDLLRVRRVGRLGGFVNQLEDAARASQRVLQLRHHAGNFVKRLGILVCVREEARQAADGQMAADGRQRARKADRGIYQRVDKARAGVGQRREERRLERTLAQTLVDFVERGERLVFVAECLNELLLADGLVNQRGLFAARGGLQAEHGVGSLGDEVGNQQRQRRNQHDQQRDRRVQRQHEAQRAQNRHHAGEELGEAHQQAVGKRVHIGDHAAHRVARRMRVEVREGQVLNVRERIAADVAHGVIGDAVV